MEVNDISANPERIQKLIRRLKHVDPVVRMHAGVVLGGLLAHWDDYLQLAANQRFSHGRLLTHFVEEEHRIKRNRLHQRRPQTARLPEPWAIGPSPSDSRIVGR